MSKDKILIVYPDDDVRNMLEVYLTMNGYDVTCVDDSVAMLATITPENIPDAMIIEVHDEVDGYKLRRELKSKIVTKIIPIVFLVTERPHDVLRDLVSPEMELTDFITRPFHIEELKLHVQSVIKRGRRYEQR